MASEVTGGDVMVDVEGHAIERSELATRRREGLGDGLEGDRGHGKPTILAIAPRDRSREGIGPPALWRRRQQLGGLKDLSFDTISAFGPNGALPHYKGTAESNLRFTTGTLYLEYDVAERTKDEG